MIWTYSLLFAVLLRISAAQTSNPFISISDVVFGKVFIIRWEPTTQGTVTITLVALDKVRGVYTDVVILGRTISNTGYYTPTVDDEATFSTFYALRIESDQFAEAISYSDEFTISDTESGEGDANTSTAPQIRATTAGIPSKPTDFNSPAPSQSHTSISITTGTPTADTATTGSSLPSESSTPSSTGLSSGAAAGIGVGATLGALILLGIGGFLWWRGRKRSRGLETSAPASALETMESKSNKRASELQGTGVIPAELQGTAQAELQGATSRAELA